METPSLTPSYALLPPQHPRVTLPASPHTAALPCPALPGGRRYLGAAPDRTRQRAPSPRGSPQPPGRLGEAAAQNGGSPGAGRAPGNAPSGLARPFPAGLTGRGCRRYGGRGGWGGSCPPRGRGSRPAPPPLARSPVRPQAPLAGHSRARLVSVSIHECFIRLFASCSTQLLCFGRFGCRDSFICTHSYAIMRKPAKKDTMLWEILFSNICRGKERRIFPGGVVLTLVHSAILPSLQYQQLLRGKMECKIVPV